MFFIPVLTLVVLNMLKGLDWNLHIGVKGEPIIPQHLCVSPHDIVIHDRLPAEERETARAGFGGGFLKLFSWFFSPFLFWSKSSQSWSGSNLHKTQPKICSVAFWSQCPTCQNAKWEVWQFCSRDTHSILKGLIPRHVPGARRMDPPTGGTDPLVLLHHVNQADHRLWLEVNITVKCKKEGVLRPSLKSWLDALIKRFLTSFLSSLIGSSMIL